MATAEDPPRGELDPNLRHRLPLPRWGDRRTPRRAAADRSSADRIASAGPVGCRRSPPAQDGAVGEDGGLEELRAKLMGHLRVAADRMKLAAPEAAQEATRPWNLRARKAPNGNGHGGCAGAGMPTAAAAATADEEEKKRKSGLTVSLTAEEIEEDIYAVTGSRPRRRPKKRPRVVQRLLDSLFPGLWLSEITVESYKVEDD
ncbi:hypothetical protein Cni_G07369 [Canna indica]|uniref:DUF1639 family protein n=1 Tax=Canna indica TaxID=4628 RepID=A0AAQ3K0Y8_9LILI|nr:hypothetical protein Cni_G07369 [Canna indica]